MSDERPSFRDKMNGLIGGTSRMEQDETSETANSARVEDDGIRLASTDVRPSVSHLVTHSAKEKGKGKSHANPDDEVEARKRKRPRPTALNVERTPLVSPSPVLTPGATYNCKTFSTKLFSDIGCPSYSFPPEAGIRCFDSYSSVSIQGTKLVAEINRLVVDYEDVADQKDAAIAAERSRGEAFQALANERKTKIKEQRRELAGLRNQVEDLSTSLNEMRLREETVVRKAVDKANHEMEARLKAQMQLAKQKVGELNGLPRDRMIDYMECRGNLQIIEQIRRTPQFDYDAEVERLTGQKKDLAGSYSYFKGLVTDLESIIESPFGERDAEHAEQVDLPARPGDDEEDVELDQEESEAEHEDAA